jgi:hypothetical protein
MSDDTVQPKPKLEVVPSEQLDEEEEEFRRLRRDVPGVKGAGEIGIISISVGRQPSPRTEFYRTAKFFRPVVQIVAVEVGLDKQFVAVAPNMVEPLSSIGINTRDFTLYLIVSPRNTLRVIPVRGPDPETGTQNEWDRSKEMALLDGVDAWVRMYSDREGSCYRSYPAPIGRFGEPAWPTTLKPAKIFRMCFRDRGRLIDSTDHALVRAWAGRDR